ncbi:MAG: hypothetical protein RL272_220, partial [Candidatus Parcubacteria bacterium]
EASPIFVARDNGTATFTIADGGYASINLPNTAATRALYVTSPKMVDVGETMGTQMSVKDLGAYSSSPRAGIGFSFKYDSAGNYAGGGGIDVGKVNAVDGDYASFMTFHTRANGGSVTERMRLNDSGYLGIGDSTPAAMLTVGSGDLFQVNSSGDIVKIDNVTYNWPSSQGGSSTVLTNDGSGNLSWGTPSGTGANTALSNLSSVAINTSLLPASDDTIDLGDNTHRWRDLYLGAQTMHLGTSTTDEAVVSYTTSTNILDFSTDATSNGDIAFFTDDLYLDKSAGFVGMGTTAPDDNLHVFAGSAGTVASNASADLTIEDSTTAYLNFLTPDANENGILFGIASNAADGGIVYNNQANAVRGFQFRTGGNNTRMTIDSSGNVGVGDLTPDATLDVDGSFGATMTGTQAFTVVGSGTTTDMVTMTGNSLTSGNLLSLASSTINSGDMLNISATGASTNAGARLINADHTATYTTTTSLNADYVNFAQAITASTASTTLTLNSIGSLMSVSRSLVSGNATANFDVQAPLAFFQNSVSGTGTLTDSSDVMDVVQSSATNTGAALRVTSTATGSGSYVFRADDASGDTTPFVIDTAGNVGVGNASPSVPLDVTGEIDSTALKVSGASGAYVGDGTSKIWMGGSGGANYLESGNDAWNASATLNITGYNGNSGTFVFTGNVGIGTSPAQELDVAGQIQFDINTTGDTTIGVCKNNADGTSANTEFVECNGTPGDIAEWYETEAGTNAADIVVTTAATLTYEADHTDASTGLTTGTDTLTASVLAKSAAPYQGGMIGVVSSSPVQTFGKGLIDESSNPQPIAVAGRVPLKVNMENGAIAPGDPITSSSTAGVGMKATQPGAIVGYALAAWSGPGQGTVLAFISPGFHMGDSIEHAPAAVASSGTPGIDSFGLVLRGSAWDAGASAAVDRGLTLTNVVTDKDSYKLSLKNQDGTEVSYLGSNGDVALSGKLYPSDRGVLQTNKYIYYDGSSGLGGDFMRTNASGWGTGSYDFAE